jgi:hypothetical protein
MPGQSNYFLNFPIFNYNGTAATNILARSVIANQFRDNTEIFYQYTVRDGETADAIAFNIYGKPELVWILYLFNDIIDPYYDWPLSTTELNNSIISKYGSYSNAQMQIQYYQNNWAADDSILDLNGYNALPSTLRKYWSPVIMAGNQVYQYKRASSDTIISTNQILQVPITISSGNGYVTGEYVNQGNSSGVVLYSNTVSLSLQHIIGAFNNTSITGLTSNTVSSVSNTVTQTLVISNGESVYFSPVTALDIEQQNNATKSHIRILKEDYIQTVIQAFGDSLS